MKKIIFSSLLMFFTPNIFAAVNIKEAVTPVGSCTEDINSWGHSSRCHCANSHFYSPQIGRCLPNHLMTPITLNGVLKNDVVAIGGETTGVVLISETNNTTYEIIVNSKEQKNLKHTPIKCRVTGIPVTILYLERGEVPAFIVHKLNCKNNSSHSDN